MDSFTHALLAGAFFSTAGLSGYISYVILGAIIPDADILFHFLSGRNPARYILTHGGLMHSLLGATILATLVFLAVTASTGSLAVIFPGMPLAAAWFAVILGVLLHIFLDTLAYPGLPLIYPVSDTKYTAGIFAGPSLFMLVTSAVTVTLLVAGLSSAMVISMYVLVFLAVLASHAALKIFVSTRVEGRTIPTIDPVWWIVLQEDADSCTVLRFHLVRGITGEEIFPRRSGISREEVDRLRTLPEVRRLFYNSYTVIASREDGVVVFRDPLRRNGYIFYPPHYAEVKIPAAGSRMPEAAG